MLTWNLKRREAHVGYSDISRRGSFSWDIIAGMQGMLDVIAFMVRIRIRIRNRHYSDDQRLGQFYHDTLQIGSAPACAYLLRVLLAPRPKRTDWPYEAGSKEGRKKLPSPRLSVSPLPPSLALHKRNETVG